MGKQAMALALLCAVLLAASSCNPSALSACAPALFGRAVTLGCCASLRAQQCCASLRAQQPCLCQYKRDPANRAYVNGPAAQRFTRACGLTQMKC
jgi:hypothetical protein